MDYTCTDYRIEMILLSLKRRLQHETLSDADKKDILVKIKEMEALMGLE